MKKIPLKAIKMKVNNQKIFKKLQKKLIIL